MCWLFRLTLVAAFVFAVGIQTTEAQSKKEDKKPVTPSAEKKADSEKLDIRDLEQKYWAPKDTDFNVVQNRAYTKEKRFSYSLQYGPIINDAFNEGWNLGISANYFLNEREGVQLEYVSFNVSDNSTVKGFANQYGGVRPNIGRVANMWGVGYNWVPIYAKMSLLGQRIIYFDMAVTPVLGMMNYEQTTKNGNKNDSSFTYGVDITQYFFLSKHIAIRADLKNRWWTEEILHWTSGLKDKTQTTNSTLFFIGVTYYH
ncbi:MAG: outer membrane beta-barrel domain-containing protein [Bdellovibrionales bacterium]|nr:outer membrane beta-barrel domain-containing protein [Bdellovibrionales bacterium]